jgi:hypothetical protein
MEAMATFCLVDVIDHRINQLAHIWAQGFFAICTFSMEVLTACHVASLTFLLEVVVLADNTAGLD